MEFSFTEEQEVLRSQVRRLLEDVCPPEYAAKCDVDAVPPREAYNAMAEQGWLRLILPEEYGGVGGSPIDLAILLEEAGRAYEELGIWMFRSMVWGGYAILTHGTEAQKSDIIPKMATGEYSFCFGLSEPESGSDAAALKTSATLKGSDYVINGQKVWTSGMDIAKYCLLVARTTQGEKKQQGITNFLVDTSLPGIEIQKIDTLGHRGIGTTQVFYSDVHVPAEMTLGEVDNGWANTDAYLWYERLCLSAARYGAATSAFDYALQYAKERNQFGRPIGKFQAISHKLAEMKVMLETTRLLVYQFAWKMGQGAATRHDAAIVKLYSGETYKNVSDMGLQILGGYGFATEYPMQRFFRDSRLAVIGGGTSEIQKNIIAKNLGL